MEDIAQDIDDLSGFFSHGKRCCFRKAALVTGNGFFINIMSNQTIFIRAVCDTGRRR